MIQELLGASTSTLLAGERKSSINGSRGGGGIGTGEGEGAVNNLLSTTPSPSHLPPPTTTTTTSSENLRCPRCDSSNTKFCYYNNYNLTQPRHFCKTCRRYWTKGGALRNVPIGGGCRKNKTIGLSSSAAKSSSTKVKTIAPELGRSPVLGPGFEVEQHDLPPPSQILWGSPQNTHLLALLRSSQNQNPNPNLNPNPVSAMTVKEEGMNLLGSISQSQMVNEPLVSNLLSQRYDGGHGVGQVVPSLGLCNSFWGSSQQNNNGGFVLGEHQIQNGGSSIQELYHKLRSSSSSNYCGENYSSQVFLGNVAASNSNSSSISNNIIEPSSGSAAGEFGFWNNPTLYWPDLPTTNGAYP